MNLDNYVAQRDENDPAFHEARERQCLQHDYRRALVSARLQAGITQKELAERAGMKQSVIARLEAGGRLPTLATVQRLAVALGIDFLITAAGTIEIHSKEAA